MSSFSLDIISCETFVSRNAGEMFNLQNHIKESSLDHIPPIERRRLSTGARGVFSIVSNYQYPVIFSSFNAEINRCFGMYESLKNEAFISPTTFSLSVLNAIAALYAIIYKNTSEILAIAEEMSVEYGLLNAYLLTQNTKECLLLVYREIEGFKIQDGIIVIAMRVKKGNHLTLTQKKDNQKRQDLQESEVAFLQNYGIQKQWVTYGKTEKWEWNASV